MGSEAKKKAKEILDKFNKDISIQKDGNTVVFRSIEYAKQCALITLEFTESIGVSPQDKIYLQEIKQEILKLC